MKKHQTIAIVLIIIFAIIAAIFIFGSKKSTETPTQSITPQPLAEPRDNSTYQGELSAPETSVVPAPTQVPTTYTLAQVATHNSRSSCYTAISGNVYNVTEWIGEHPGGQFAILSMCGKDATSTFTSQHGGQKYPESKLASFKIGILVQ